MRPLILFTPCVSLCFSVAVPARAALDPELKKPYQLRVVLHVAEQRILTPIFQQQLERELAAHLRLAYGPLARVEVVRVHRLLKDIRARGLRALDDWDELSEIKTHFVLLDYAAGCYRLRARQHDGMTGMASPVIRRAQTAEPRLVARTAARLVDRDFGLTGTVERVSGDQVDVAIKGGDLGVPLTRWIRPGEVFAIARIAEQGGKRQASRLESAVLVVQSEPQGGVCRCKLFHRWARDTLQEQPGVLGYRCLKLTTTTGPVRLRVLNESGKPVNGARVHVSGVGYAPDSPGKDRTTGVDGLIATQEDFANVAFVRVSSGGRMRARFPIEIVDDRIVVRHIDDRAVSSSAEELQTRRDHWVRRTEECLELVNSRITDLNEALKRSPEAALAAARQAVKGIKTDLDSLYAERDQIRQDATKIGGIDIGEGERAIQQMRDQSEKIEQFAARQEALIKEAASPERRVLESKLERAHLLETQADFAEAIQLYESVVAKNKDAKSVAKHLAKLKADWAIPEGDEEHRQAREFIYHTWPRLDPTGVRNEIKQATKAFTVCRKRGDRLTPQKLLLINATHAINLKKRLEVLRSAPDNEDNRAETKALLQTAGELRRLHAEVNAFLRNGKASQ